MKALLVLFILLTLALIAFVFKRNKNYTQFLVALGTFGVIAAMAVLGNITRQVTPLFVAHGVLLLASWGGLLVYLFRNKYYWWIIFSPLFTVVLFLLLEFLTGSRHEAV